MRGAIAQSGEYVTDGCHTYVTHATDSRGGDPLQQFQLLATAAEYAQERRL
ncbi:MAG: hypothetical protein JNK85_11315 [Verrucomicrobiales bacterium]|nr:hypothetical protein [Verrucomicrobiales bacterium]